MTERAWEAAVAALADARHIGAVGHVGPDGDALGSSLAVALAARDAGKEAYVSFGEPFVLGSTFDFLDVTPLVSPTDLPRGLDVVVACDTADASRLGSVADVATSARTLLVVDHHPSNDGFGDVRIIDPRAAATAQLVYRLLRRLEWPIGPQTATALYTGLVTDTGRFQYSATTPEVHRIAAELLEAGVRPEVVGQRLFEEAPFASYRVIARVMGRAVLEERLGLVWSILLQEDLAAAGLPYEEVDDLIDLVRIAREAGVACLLREIQPGTLKGSLRSRGVVDVGAIAARLGGGGHRNAAGFTFEGSPEAAIAVIREALR